MIAEESVRQSFNICWNSFPKLRWNKSESRGPIIIICLFHVLSSLVTCFLTFCKDCTTVSYLFDRNCWEFSKVLHCFGRSILEVALFRSVNHAWPKSKKKMAVRTPNGFRSTRKEGSKSHIPLPLVILIPTSHSSFELKSRISRRKMLNPASRQTYWGPSTGHVYALLSSLPIPNILKVFQVHSGRTF